MIALSPGRVITLPRLSPRLVQSQRENVIVALSVISFVAIFGGLVMAVHYRLTAEEPLLVLPSDIMAVWVVATVIAIVAAIGLLALATMAWSVITMREFRNSTEPLLRRHTVACVLFFPALAIAVTVAVILARAF